MWVLRACESRREKFCLRARGGVRWVGGWWRRRMWREVGG